MEREKDLSLPERMTSSLLLQVPVGVPKIFLSPALCVYMSSVGGAWCKFLCSCVPVVVPLCLPVFCAHTVWVYECAFACECMYASVRMPQHMLLS